MRSGQSRVAAGVDLLRESAQAPIDSMKSTDTLVPGAHLAHIELTASPVRIDIFPTDELCDIAIRFSIVITVRIAFHLLDYTLEEVLFLLPSADGVTLAYRFLSDYIACMTLSVHIPRIEWYVGLPFVQVRSHILSRVASVLKASFFHSVINALLATHTEVLSWLLPRISIVVCVLLVFDFYPIKVLGHVILPPISSLLLLGLTSRILLPEMLKCYLFELLCLRKFRSRLSM